MRNVGHWGNGEYRAEISNDDNIGYIIDRLSKNNKVKIGVLITLPEQTILITSMILEVFTMKENKFIGKLIIMIEIISFVQKIRVIQA